jgi:hypothetical protein
MTKHINPYLPLADQLVAGEATVITATLRPAVAFESARNRHERTFAVRVLPKPLDVLFLGWNYIYEGYKLYGGDSSTFYPTKAIRVLMLSLIHI